MKTQKVLVACPSCAHTQLEAPQAYSTICKKCGHHFRVQEVLHPPAPPKESPLERKHHVCFKCGGVLEVAATAQSTMCKHCGSHVDLHDYRIANTVAKNFRTKGKLVVEEGGLLLNTETVAGDVVLKGRLLGKLTAERSLEIHTGAEIKGSFWAACLVIPPGHLFRWPEPLKLGNATIAGEVSAKLCVEGIVVLKSTARLFGEVRARHLVVESGAVLVGAVAVGVAPPPAPPPPAPAP
jgi:cytoskeletal protein CcmA (bactofilin family)